MLIKSHHYYRTLGILDSNDVQTCLLPRVELLLFGRVKWGSSRYDTSACSTGRMKRADAWGAALPAFRVKTANR